MDACDGWLCNGRETVVKRLCKGHFVKRLCTGCVTDVVVKRLCNGREEVCNGRVTLLKRLGIVVNRLCNSRVKVVYGCESVV